MGSVERIKKMPVCDPCESHIVAKEGGTRFGRKGQASSVYHSDTSVVVRAIWHRHPPEVEGRSCKNRDHFQ